MELTKIIRSGVTEVTDDADATLRIRLIDVSNSASLMDIGELRISNEDLSLNGLFVKDADIEVEIGLGDNEPTKVFAGVIGNVIDGQLIVMDIYGNAYKLKGKTVTKSLNRTDAGQVIREILSGADVQYELGTLPATKRHSYVLQGGTIIEEVYRWNKSFELNFIPFFNRDGVLILKTAEENFNPTDIVFNEDEFRRFENGILETIVDVEVKPFDELKIMDVDYYIASNRFLLNDRKSKSLITVTEV